MSDQDQREFEQDIDNFFDILQKNIANGSFSFEDSKCFFPKEVKARCKALED